MFVIIVGDEWLVAPFISLEVSKLLVVNSLLHTHRYLLLKCEEGTLTEGNSPHAFSFEKYCNNSGGACFLWH
jgi:hypothetical protein